MKYIHCLGHASLRPQTVASRASPSLRTWLVFLELSALKTAIFASAANIKFHDESL